MEVSFGEVFRRFLVIHEFVLDGVSKINYFRSRRIRWRIREVWEKSFGAPIFAKRNGHDDLKLREFSGKRALVSSKSNFGGPAGGSAPGKVLRPRIFLLHDS